MTPPVIPVMGFAAPSGRGKTTLMEAVIRRLDARGLRVAAIKHGHHAIDFDVPGKDSYRFRQAGARTVLFAGANLWFMVQRIDPTDAAFGLEEHFRRVAPGHDLVLVEGYKSSPWPKIAVMRSALSSPGEWREIEGVVAVAADGPVSDLPPDLPWLSLDDPEAVAAFIVAYCGLEGRGRT